MDDILKKLKCKNIQRIAVLNADDDIYSSMACLHEDMIIDKEIDLPFPYEYVIVFVKTINEIKFFTPKVIHNLYADGILWFCYPARGSKKNRNRTITKDWGWTSLHKASFRCIKSITVNEDWEALRFRNSEFIKKNGYTE